MAAATVVWMDEQHAGCEGDTSERNVMNCQVAEAFHNAVGNWGAYGLDEDVTYGQKLRATAAAAGGIGRVEASIWMTVSEHSELRRWAHAPLELSIDDALDICTTGGAAMAVGGLAGADATQRLPDDDKDDVCQSGNPG